MSTVKEVKELWAAWQNCGCDDWDCRHYIECHDALDALTSGITPEQQAVLDAAVAWREVGGSVGSMLRATDNLAAAVDAMTRKPSVADRLETWLRDDLPDNLREGIIAEVRALEAGK